MIQFLTATLLSLPCAQVGGELTTLSHLDGDANKQVLGLTMAGLGDINGDGFDDIIHGMPYANNGRGQADVISGATGQLLYQYIGAQSAWVGFRVADVGDINADGSPDFAILDTVINAGSMYAGGVNVYSGATGGLLHRFDGDDVSVSFWRATISGAGDVNGDGFDDVIIGCPYEDGHGFAWSGRVFVFSGASGSLLYSFGGWEAYINLGASVDGAGDLNNDGFDDFLIGAVGANSPRPSSGRVNAISGATGLPIYQFNGETMFSYLGAALAGLGDLNGDGVNELLLGMPSGYGYGKANVVSGATGLLLYQVSGSGVSDDSFGYSCANAGDIDFDGVDDFIVGAPHDHFGGNSSGSIYLYSGASGTLLARQDGAGANFQLGFVVSGAGDMNGDGALEVLAGAPFSNLTYTNAGSVDVFSFHPFLSSDTRTVSASTGGTISLALAFPFAAALYEYKVLASVSGTGPMTYGVEIPLTLDSLVQDTFVRTYPVPVHNMHGTLDASGKASATLTVPTGGSTAFIGTTFYLAAIANQLGQLPEYSSIAVSLEITP